MSLKSQSSTHVWCEQILQTFARTFQGKSSNQEYKEHEVGKCSSKIHHLKHHYKHLNLRRLQSCTFPELSIPFNIPTHKTIQLRIRHKAIHQTIPPVSSIDSEIFKVWRNQKYSVEPLVKQASSYPVKLLFKGQLAYGRGSYQSRKKIV